MKDISAVIETVRAEQGLRTSGKQESAVRTAFLYNLSVITGSPGTGKTTVLKIILEVYRRIYPDGKIVLMAHHFLPSEPVSWQPVFHSGRSAG